MSCKVRILFVDDDQQILNGLQRALRKMSDRWEMYFYSDAVSALRLMDQTPMDVVVSDMKMPGMGGDAFLSAIRERHPETIRIILSGQCDTATAVALVGHEDRFLQKPWNSTMLINVVDAALQGEMGSHLNASPTLDHDELAEAFLELTKTMLMKGVLSGAEIPPALYKRLPAEFQDCFRRNVSGDYDELTAPKDNNDREALGEEGWPNILDFYGDKPGKG